MPNLLEEIANKIILEKRIKNGSRDESDNRYIECGITADVDYIISGDIHLLELRKYENIKIITAKEYLEIINNPAASSGVCCSHKELHSGFNTFLTAPRGGVLNPSARIK